MKVHRRLAAVLGWGWLLLALAGPAGAAPPQERVVRVGYLGLIGPGPDDDGKIVGELARLGYVEGRNLQFEVSHADGDPTRLAAAAADLLKRKVDVIFASTNAAAFAAKAATRSLPIVVWAAHGAVETGLVASMRRPGGNITGTESLAIELDAKRLELVRQLAPRLRRMAVVFDGTDQGSPHHLTYVQTAGQRLHLGIDAVELRRADDFDRLLLNARTAPGSGVYLMTSNLTYMVYPRVIELALKRGMPSFCEFRAFAEEGCLMSYGPSFDEMTQRCAAQIDKILRGAAPGDLPIEQPTRFELVINLKTARALGLTVPQELLLRADAVIE